jgi:hypothetical protein
MLLTLAALIIQLPPLPMADPCAEATIKTWANLARARLRNEANAEYAWGGAGPAHLGLMRRLPDEAPGKQQYVEFLKETYGYNIDRLNAAYGLSASSFTDLYSLDYRSLDTTRRSVRQDDLAFLKSVNEVLFAEARKVTGRSVRFLQ